MVRTVKLISVLTIFLVLTVIVSNVFATGGLTVPDPTYENTSGINTLGGKIIGIVQAIGMVIAVLIIVVLGIKYIMGSAEEKAEYKKTMIPYLIGAVLLFAASAIVKVIYNFASGLSA